MPTGVGLRIKNRRKELGLSQEALANRMGLRSKSTICKIERGEDNLTTDTIEKYAEALRTTPAYLMGWEDTKIEQPEENNDTKARIVEWQQQFVKFLEKYSEEDVRRVLGMAELYEKATPEVRQTIDMILKSTQQNP